MGQGPLVVETTGSGVATVTINRPEKRNALDKPLWGRLRDVMTEVSGRETLRCVVLRGAPRGGFGAGADIHEFVREREGREKARAYGLLHAEALSAVRNCIHPVIAAIEGPCMGASLVLAAACDLRLARDDARFALPPMKLGATLGYPEVGILLEVLGPAALMEILLEGHVFDALRAREIGLVSRVVGEAAFDADVTRTAEAIAGGAPLTQRAHKRFIYKMLSGERIDPAEFDRGYAAFDSDDFKEGYRAFLEKRRAKFAGR